MNQIPTADDFFDQWCKERRYSSIDECDDIGECLIEFVKMHRYNILQKAADSAKVETVATESFGIDGSFSYYYEVDKESILNCYPEDLIQ